MGHLRDRCKGADPESFDRGGLNSSALLKSIILIIQKV